MAAKYPAVLFVLLPWPSGSSWDEGRGAGRGSCKIANLKSFNFQSAIQRRPFARQAEPPSPVPRPPSPARRPLWSSRDLPARRRSAVAYGSARTGCSPAIPTYPLLYGAFDGRTWNAKKNPMEPGPPPARLLRRNARQRPAGGVVLSSPWLSPLVVPVGGAGILLGARRRCQAACGLAKPLPGDCSPTPHL